MGRHRRAVLLAFVAVAALGLAPAASAQVTGAIPLAAQVPLSPLKIPQFVQPLDTLNTGAAGIANPTGNPTIPVALGNAIELSICEFQTNILPAGTVKGQTPTWVWGYHPGATCPTSPQNRPYLGPVVIAERGTPTQMTFHNRLPDATTAHVMAYKASTDQTLNWGDPLGFNTNPPQPESNECYLAAQALPPGGLMPAACLNNYGYDGVTASYVAPVPAAVHLHGGEVPAMLDGGPDSWWTPNGITGHGYYSKGGVADASPAKGAKAVYVYPNGQEAAPIWFHDHMLGATRLNVYAGIAGGYVVTEPAEAYAPGLHPLGLSDSKTGTLTEPTIPLIIQDRMFDTTGQLYFPNIGINPEHPFWVPEFVGDVIVVNGKAWPFLNVQPKRYRFIFLNGSNARAYELFLMSKTTGLKGPSLWVIGNDQGLLDTPQQVNPNLNVNNKLAMMPGERYEVIIDFSSVAGQTIEMRNTARTPYVGGSPVNGNTTGRIIRFVVAPAAVPAVADTSYDPALEPPRATPMQRLTLPFSTTAAVPIHKVRRMTVNEVIAAGGPLEILVNNTLYDGSKKNPNTGLLRTDFVPVSYAPNTSYYSELPIEGETELWEIINLTADAHPMHPHLVAFQVLNRQALDVNRYNAAYTAAYTAKGLLDPVTGLPLEGYGPPYDYNSSDIAGCSTTTPGPVGSGTDAAKYRANENGVAPCVLGGNPDPGPAGANALVGLPLAPMPQEIGWKDTVQALPNMVTRVLVRFAKTDVPAGEPPDSIDAGYDFEPSEGHGYVWHCHIVDHEDNEMMRPFAVTMNGNKTRTFLPGEY